MQTAARRIGPIGTSTLLLVAAGLLYLALFDWTIRGLTWYDAALALGLVAASLLAGLRASRSADGPVRCTGSAWIALFSPLALVEIERRGCEQAVRMPVTVSTGAKNSSRRSGAGRSGVARGS